MTLFATARSIPGTLRQEIVVDGRHRLVTDQPERLGGDGSGPAPHELFPAALAGCIASTLARYARTKGWDLGQVTVDVDYDHHSTPRRFEIVVRLGAELSEAQLERLERVARSCPLRRSIEAGIEFVEHLEPRGRADETVGPDSVQVPHPPENGLAGSRHDPVAEVDDAVAEAPFVQ